VWEGFLVTRATFFGQSSRFVRLTSAGRTGGGCSRFGDWELSREFVEVGLLIFILRGQGCPKILV
jgi:hypothetical protein